jgi:nucleoside-diphosphate-sugar epimerase
MGLAFITGGFGFIGTFIARQLIEENHVEKVVCLDHFGRYADSAQPDFNDYRKLRLEGITDRIIVERGEAKSY